ncbi:MAG: hypothetical protein H7X77_00460 [Anaerolineae bacterium]|nr:hypothetical protein [Anaerolineae bacterium]
MRKLFILPLLMLAVMLMSLSTSSSAQFITLKIMPLGDSLTEGYPQMQGGYRPQFWNRLNADGFPVELVGSMTDGFSWSQPHHEGHSGWTIADLDGQINSWLTTSQPDVILLMIGTNDILSNQQNGMVTRLEVLIDHIFTARPTARLIVAQLIPINENTMNQRVQAFNAALPDLISAKALEGKRISMVDLNSPFTFADLLDGVHLTPDAYTRLGNLWYDVTARLLREPFQQLTPVVGQSIHTPVHPFSWTQGTPDETYKIKVRSLDGIYRFKQNAIPASVCVDGICRLTLNFGLTPPPDDLELKWKVISATDKTRKTGWQNFETDFPGSTTLLQPAHNTQITSLTPDFQWTVIPDANQYTLLLDHLNQSTPEGFTRLVNFTFNAASSPSLADICDLNTEICTVNLAALSTALTGSGNYRWRIKTSSVYGTNRSPKFLFSVNTAAAPALIPLPVESISKLQ